MKIKIRSHSKYIEVKITARKIEFDSGRLSVKEAEEYLELFDQAARNIQNSIDEIKNMPSLDQSYQKE